MTPFIREPQPDERPSTAEIVGAIVLAIVGIIGLWIVGVLTTPY